jgi:hypothetical protein
MLFPGLWTSVSVGAKNIVPALRPRKDASYIARSVPSLPLLSFINRSLPADAPIFSFNMDRYYCDARFYQGWSVRTGRRALEATSAEEAAEALRDVGVSGILFSDEEQKQKRCLLFEPAALRRYFRRVKSQNGWHFYVWASSQPGGEGRG